MTKVIWRRLLFFPADDIRLRLSPSVFLSLVETISSTAFMPDTTFKTVVLLSRLATI